MSAKRRRTARDTRRRKLGQNFLADRREVQRIIEAADVRSDELIVEVGAGRGALTLPLARAGARVISVETDPTWVERLQEGLSSAGLDDRVEVRHGDLQSIRFPDDAYRVISNPPFGLSTALFCQLFDDPGSGPWRADLLLQHEVARKRAASPPTSLRSAAWAPWWEFELGHTVPARAFRPIPRVDAALLTVRRRDPAVLPEWLGPQMRQLLRPGWHPPGAGS